MTDRIANKISRYLCEETALELSLQNGLYNSLCLSIEHVIQKSKLKWKNKTPDEPLFVEIKNRKVHSKATLKEWEH